MRNWFTCDEVVEVVVQALFLFHAQLPAIGVFHSDLLCGSSSVVDGKLGSLVDGRKSNKLFKRSVSRVLSLIM